MAPFVTLCSATLIARLAGLAGIDYVGTWVEAVAVGLAVMFTLTGLAHFAPAKREGLIAIVPPALPHPQLLVTVTGLMELAGAVALLVPSGLVRNVAASALVVLLLAVFPANVHAARERRSATAPATPLGRRTALQGVFLSAASYVALCA
ncbi:MULTISPECIES: DoxX family protein [unclassified Luteococcus]|uniref:DoxX family protein n=1 Tax=unclassified Luteococcus TaxID=2639923 RepID=UPI00313DF328